MHQRYKCNRSISHDNVQYEVGQVILLDLTTAESLLQIDAIKQIEEVEGIELPGALQKTDEQLMVLKEIAASLQQMSSGFSAVVLTVSALMTRMAAANPASGSTSNQPDNQAPVNSDASNAQATDAPSADAAQANDPVSADTGNQPAPVEVVADPELDTANALATDTPSVDAEQASVNPAPDAPIVDAPSPDAEQAATSDEEASATAKKARSKKTS